MSMNLKVLNFLTCILLTFSLNLLGVWEPPQFYGDGTDIDIASDANGNAVVIFSSLGLPASNVTVYNYTSLTNTWSPATLLQADTVSEVSVAMDNSGSAVAIWSNNNGINEVRTAFYNGSTWLLGTPAPLEAAGFVSSPVVAMNGPNSAVAAWVDSSTTVRSSFFTGGAWSAPTTIGTTDDREVRIAYSTNGTAVAGFTNVNPTAANFIGGVWQAPVPLDAGTVFGPVEVGIDANGKALAAWLNNTTLTVLSSFFNGSSWQAPVPLGTVANFTFAHIPSLAMAPTGTAVATWSTGGAPSLGLSRSFNGANWGPIQQFSADVNERTETVPVAVDDFGNAIVLFDTPEQLAPPTNLLLRSARLPLGGVWGNFQVVTEGPAVPPFQSFELLATDLSNNGFAFAAGEQDITEVFRFFATVDLVPFPPASIEGRVCKNNFAAQTDRIHIITFTPSPSTTVDFYELRRNGQLIAVIPATGPFTYFDHSRCKKDPDVYTVIAVDGNGTVSVPVTVTLQ